MLRIAILFFWVLSLTAWGQGVCRAETEHQNSRVRQVSSYQKMESAVQERDRLKSKGIEAYFKEVEIPGKGTWYRVFAEEKRPQNRMSPPAKEKKRPQKAVKPAHSASSATAGGTVVPITDQRAGESARVAKGAGSGMKQAIFSSRLLPSENGRKPETPAGSKGGDAPASIPAGQSPVCSEYEAAKTEFDAHRYQQAAGMLNALLSSQKSDAALYESSLRLLADCLYFLDEKESGKYGSQTIESYRNILRHYPDPRSGNDVANFRLADILERTGGYEEAYEAYSNVLSKYPDSPYGQEALFRMGKILYQTKRYTHAIDKLKKYLSLSPDGSYAFQASFLLGYCLRQTNQRPEGDAWYRNALNKWSSFDGLTTDILHDLGLYRLSQGDYTGSANLFLLCFNLQPDGDLRKNALYNLGRSHYFGGRFSTALKVFSLLLESYPNTLEANEGILFMANIGVMDPKAEFNACMAGRDYFKNPIETYDWMRTKYPGGYREEWLLYQKGYALCKSGRFKESLELYCRLLDAFPHGRLHQESRAYLVLNATHLIEEARAGGDFLAVADLYYRVRNKVPLSAESMAMFFRIGDSLWKTGLKADAVALLDRLKQKNNQAMETSVSDLIMLESDRSQEEMTDEKWKALLAELARNGGDAADAARRNLADYFYGKGRYDRVIPLYEELIKAKGRADFLPISRNYAHALRHQGLCSSAVSRYREILDACREDPQKCDQGFVADVCAGMGDCYYETGDYQNGLAMYSQAFPGIRHRESSMWALFRMGQSYHKLNDGAMAGKSFAQLKEQSGDAFWPKVADYWVADQEWSRSNRDYLEKN